MIRLAWIALALVLASTCQRRPVVASPPRHDVLVLLPNPDTHTVGRAIVSSPLGADVELTSGQEATQVVVGKPPGAPFTMSTNEVQRLFGEAMKARPPAPRQFLLYFFTGTTQLTPESEALLATILDFVRNRPAPDVTVIGHTDTAYTARSNFTLGLDRATSIRNLLVTTGLDGTLVSVASHGEADLLVPTPDDTPEPRNRRVEVSVR